MRIRFASVFLRPAGAVACSAAALFVLGGHMHGQERFRAGVDVVRVDVLVTDGDRAVAGLAADDFELRDQGVVQTIQSSIVANIPVSLLLALDTSRSLEGPPLARLKEASEAALDALRPDDRGALLTFAGAPRLHSTWGEPRTAPRRAIQMVQAGGSTSLFDAVFTAFTLRDMVPGTRSLIILFSDGADTSSWLPPQAVLDTAHRSDTVVYSVTTGARARDTTLQFRSGIPWHATPERGRSAEPTPFLEELAEITGGSAFVARGADGLRATFTRIVTEFQSRYVLTYTPEGVGGAGWHAIEVKLKGKKGRVIARRGYHR